MKLGLELGVELELPIGTGKWAAIEAETNAGIYEIGIENRSSN